MNFYYYYLKILNELNEKKEFAVKQQHKKSLLILFCFCFKRKNLCLFCVISIMICY